MWLEERLVDWEVWLEVAMGELGEVSELLGAELPEFIWKCEGSVEDLLVACTI